MSGVNLAAHRSNPISIRPCGVVKAIHHAVLAMSYFSWYENCANAGGNGNGAAHRTR